LSNPALALERAAPPDSSWLTRAAWTVVTLATMLRLIVGARLPLSGDEAYYWEWSRHLALGYIDHPPMVAWLIAAFSLGIKSTLLIRLPFVLCGLGTAVALSAFATRATGDARAGAVAAAFASLAPFGTIAFTMAAPDGPELFFWSLSLYLALRALEPRASIWRLPLALSVAATLLSSVLGGFLALGVAATLALAAREARARDAAALPGRHALLALLLFAAALAPYAAWDAINGWHALRFALSGRHTFVPGGDFLGLLGVFAAVLTPGVFIATFPTIARLTHGHSLVERLLLLTSLPLLAVCLGLSLRESVEFNWADGAFISLLAALGLYAARMFTRAAFALLWVPAVAIAGLLFAIAAAPMETLHVAEDAFGVHLRNQGAFEIYAFEPAARDVAREARATGAAVMTDGYGLSSVLDYYADIPPVVIGYDAQGREARRWLPAVVPAQAIFFDKEPLASRPDFQRQLALACGSVRDDGTRTYELDGQVTRTFYLTRCDGLTQAGFALLLFPKHRAR
jgi:4-amino-4-deoxy-L-arabinose transferase-like glycosyltransferase